MILQTLHTIRELRASLRVLFITTLISQAGTMAFPFFAAYLLASDLYPGDQVALMVAAFGVGALVADILAGPILAVATPRTVMTCTLLFNSFVLAAIPFLGSAGGLVVSIFVWGFAYELYAPACYSEIIENSLESERKVAFSCYRLAINLGGGLGPALGGLVFAWEPRGIFVFNSVFAAAAAVYLLSRAHSHASSSWARHAGERVKFVLGSSQSEARFWTVFGLAIPIHLAYALPPTLLSAYVINQLGMSSVWAGTLFFVNAGCIVLFEVPLNKAMQQVSHSRSLMSGYALAAIGFVLIAVSSSGVMLIVSTLIWTAGEMIVFPSLLSYVSEISDRPVAARNMGLYSAGMNLGLIAAPQISLYLITEQGRGGPWYAAGIGILVALALMMGIRQNRFLWLQGSS